MWLKVLASFAPGLVGTRTFGTFEGVFLTGFPEVGRDPLPFLPFFPFCPGLLPFAQTDFDPFFVTNPILLFVFFPPLFGAFFFFLRLGQGCKQQRRRPLQQMLPGGQHLFLPISARQVPHLLKQLKILIIQATKRTSVQKLNSRFLQQIYCTHFCFCVSVSFLSL